MTNYNKLNLIIASLFVLSAGLGTGCDDSASGSAEMFCDTGMEKCGAGCCQAGKCDDGVCKDSESSTAKSCDPQCKDGQACSNGECVDACESNQTWCSGGCYNTKSDAMHCGDCDTACKDTESCQNGKCEVGCANGFTLIDGQCFNTKLDSEHCGDAAVNCGDNALCEDGACQCLKGNYDCDNDLSNGCESSVSCDMICDEGLSSCGPEKCFDLQNDLKHCGSCTRECKATEKCEAGQCVDNSEADCPEGQKACYGVCIDVLSDDNNCGTCENKCEEGKICHAGVCEIKCDDGLSLCGDKCIDLSKDPQHCGSCDTVCEPKQVCAANEEGAATCQATHDLYPDLDCNKDADPLAEDYVEKSECWGQCFDLASDAMNCGQCGNACEEGHVCDQSECHLVCAEGLMECGDKCVDIKTDNGHCGGCFNACETYEKCGYDAETGTSSCEAVELDCNEGAEEGAPVKTNCWGTCADLNSDEANCGACGHACEEEEVCYNGSCIAKTACEPGKDMCFGTCVDLMNDVQNCGKCLNSCGAGNECYNGTCRQDCGDLARCNEVCIDTQTSVHNCGTCGNECAAGQACVGGTCQCAAGYSDCDGNPVNGCESTTQCICKPTDSRKCWRGDENILTGRDEQGVPLDAKGACQLGNQTCDPSGLFWGPCTGGVYPSAITCHDSGIYIGNDQNCNGIEDTSEECVSSCDLIRTADSYIGCEYWPIYLANQPDYEAYFNHTVLISNPNSETVTVYIFKPSEFNTSPPTPNFKFDVAPGQVKIQQLSTRTTYMVEGTGITNQSYILRASRPITVYQFTPWDGSASYTADASLLLPTNVLGKKYMTMTWSPGYSTHTSNTTIVATKPGKTNVTVKMNAPIVNGNITPPSQGLDKTYTLDRFQVLNLVTSQVDGEQTGSLITSDKEIAVYGGMRCSNIPHGYGACDHLEEQMYPIQSWGKSYFAVPVERRGSSNDFWRILASEADTTVTANGSTKTLNAGQFWPIETSNVFEINANKPILVGQFMAGSEYKNANKGDPAFGLAVPYEQYRTDYSFSVPSSYNENYITIVVPNDGTLTYDGVNLNTSGFHPIGSTGFKYMYKSVTGGSHTMTGSKPFGLIGYGYSPYISYLYPIGLDLKDLTKNTN